MKKKKVIQRIGSLLLVAVLLLHPPQAFEVNAAEMKDVDARIEEAIDGAVDWCRQGQDTLFTPEFNAGLGNSVTDWLALDIGRLGIKDDYEAALEALETYVTEAYQTEELLHRAKSTEWHRISLTVLALGGDPTAFGTNVQGKPVDLIADGTYNRGYINSLGAQGLNGWIWGLITLDAMRYEVPEGSYNTREDILEEILVAQEPDGGFGLMPGSPDVDMTGMALQALAPYYRNGTSVEVEKSGQIEKVTVAAAVDKALDWLSANQLADGGFVSYGSANAESTAQVIVALCSLDIDPMQDARFIKNGYTLLDALLSFRQENGSFVHTYDGTGEDLMATEQSLYALCAMYRQRNGYRTLYDFRPEDSTQETYSSGAGAVTKILPSLDEQPLIRYFLIGAVIGVGILSVILLITLLHKRKGKPKTKKEEVRNDNW